MAMEVTIGVTGLRKRFRPVVALDGLSFMVLPGPVTGFVGPNGADKSTTMRMIAGLDEPTAGRVRVTCRRWPRPTASAGTGGTSPFHALGYVGLFLSLVLTLRVIITTTRDGI